MPSHVPTTAERSTWAYPMKDDSARWILLDVFEAMQNAEECGGPEPEGYIEMMKAISAEALARAEACRVNNDLPKGDPDA